MVCRAYPTRLTSDINLRGQPRKEAKVDCPLFLPWREREVGRRHPNVLTADPSIVDGQERLCPPGYSPYATNPIPDAKSTVYSVDLM